MKKLTYNLLIMACLFCMGSIQAQVLTEDFENWPPAGWTLDPATGNGAWVQNNGDVPTTGGNAGPGAAYEGEFAAMFNNYDYNPEVFGSITSPAFDISALSTPILHFYWWNNDAPLQPALIIIESSTNGLDFITLDTIEAAQSGTDWVEYIQLLESDVSHIKLVGVSDYGLKNTYIDALSIEEATGCLQPTDLIAYDFTSNSATIDWENGNNEESWIVEYGMEGYSVGTGTEISADAHPFTINDLESNTKYDVYVKANCGDDVSDWTGPVTFSTTCETQTELPYYEGFEEGYLGCFQVQQQNPVDTWYYSNATSPVGPYSGTGYARISYSLDDQNEWLISPVFDLTNITPTILSFYWSASYTYAIDPYNNYDLILKVSTDGENWTDLWDESMVGEFENWVYYEQWLDVSAYANQPYFQFAFCYIGNDGGAAYIDEVLLDIETGVENIETPTLQLYPNPAKDYVTIQSEELMKSIEVYNNCGQLLYSADQLNSKTYTLQLDQFTNGHYILKTTTAHTISTKTIVINR